MFDEIPSYHGRSSTGDVFHTDDLGDLDIDPDAIVESVSLTDTVGRLAREHMDRLEERIQEAAVEGYDYLYVVHDYATRDLARDPGEHDRPGESLSPTTRTLATDLEPESFLPTLSMHGNAYAYDLSDLSDAERELVAAGEIPPRLKPDDDV